MTFFTEIKMFIDIDSLLQQLAQYCIKNNLYRKDHDLARQNNPQLCWNYDDIFYHFSNAEMAHINRCCLNRSVCLTSGYMFLDDPNGTKGMIRLYDDRRNDPKWCFWMENDTIKIDWA